MVFHWSLSDSMSPQISRTLLSILVFLNNAVLWIVSTRPPTSKSSSSFDNPFVTVPKAPITIGIIVTFMFYSFFNSLARSRYLPFFSHSFSFILRSTRTAKITISLIFFVLGDLDSIPGHVMPKTLKMVLDTFLLNTQQYKVHIEGKVKQSGQKSSALPYTLVW